MNEAITNRFENINNDSADLREPDVKPGEVCKEGAARATADEKAALESGFAVAPPIYAIGSRVNELGVGGFQASRQEWEDLPTAEEACEDLAERVRAEDRQDHLRDATGLTMLDDGRLKVNGNGTYPLTHRGVDGLAFFTTPGGGSYLKNCEPELRAYNFNQWFPRAVRVDKRATNRLLREWAENNRQGPRPGDVIVPKELTLRTRFNPAIGQREIFSVVGPRYGVFDIDQVAREVAAGVPDDARCDITYDGYKARINVLFHSDIAPEKAVAGEIFKAGLLISTADDGTGSIKISAQVWRNLCLNLIIIDFKRLLVGTRRHMGQSGDIARDVKEHMEVAMKKIGYFADKWSEANVENVLDRYDLTDMEALFKGLVKNRVVHVPGIRPDDMVERLVKSWEVEPGYTKSSVLNAITRAAHTETWRTWGTAEDLERKAGELLFAKQWKVQLKEDNPFEGLM